MRIHVLNSLMLLSSAIVASELSAQGATTGTTQKPVPIVELAPTDAKTTEPFGNIFGVRPMPGNGVLVNDGVRKQLIALDANLGGRKVVLDSAVEGGNSYGRRATPFIPYLKDSTLFVDLPSSSILVIDPNGKVARVMSAPETNDLVYMATTASGTDAKGNLMYRVRAPNLKVETLPNGQPGPLLQADSAPILRANFETRTIDTVARVKALKPRMMYMRADANGTMRMKTLVNPLMSVDEWSMLSDGTLALVRGFDYHVDFIRPDGSRTSSQKLPFDWKRITDDDKRALLDSARKAVAKQDEDERAAAASGGSGLGVARAVGSAGSGLSEVPISGTGRPNNTPRLPLIIEDAPLSEIADYYPSIRAGATKPDLDGNLWILPTTSAQSTAGELIYDVVNNKGELFQRVRIPAGRSIAGFGHNGVVFLMYRDAEKGWFLERTKVDAKRVK